MQNNIQKGFFTLLTGCFLLFLTAAALHVIAGTPAALIPCKCDVPAVTLTGQGSNYATFDIETPTSDFQYWYVNKNTNASSGVITGSGSSVNIGGLTSGPYAVYFQSICPNSEVSEYVIIDLFI